MDFSMLTSILCVFVLLVCLTLSITTLTVLRNALEENDVLQEDASALVEELNACVAELNSALADGESIPTGSTPEGSTDAASECYCLRTVNGKIGIYTAEGYLVRLLDVLVDDLPPTDREALSKGICVGSWREVISLLQDYTA